MMSQKSLISIFSLVVRDRPLLQYSVHSSCQELQNELLLKIFAFVMVFGAC